MQRMLNLPNVRDVFRASARAYSDQPALTFFVAVSAEHAPLEMRRARAASVVQSALLAIRPLGVGTAITEPSRVVSFSEMQCMGVSRPAIARIFENWLTDEAGLNASSLWVPRPVFIVPEPLPYIRAWSVLCSGRMPA